PDARGIRRGAHEEARRLRPRARGLGRGQERGAQVEPVSATSPVRFPDASSPATMTKRAWWLVGLNFLIPGSVQLLAGSRRLGRFGVAATFALWVIAIVALVLLWAWPVALYTLVTN